MIDWIALHPHWAALAVFLISVGESLVVVGLLSRRDTPEYRDTNVVSDGRILLARVEPRRRALVQWSHATLVFAGALVLAVPSALAEISPRKSTRQGITVTVIPNDIGAQSETWEFLVAFHSHVAGRLRNLPRSAALFTAPHRAQQVPIEWEGLPPTEFHRQGKLRFAAPGTRPQTIEVHIAIPGERKARVFRWRFASGVSRFDPGQIAGSRRA